MHLLYLTACISRHIDYTVCLMKPQQYSTYRDLMQWELETAAKVPYIKKDKAGTTLTADASIWNSLESLEKVASIMFDEFKNLWKWIKKTHPQPEDYNSMKHSLVSLAFLLKHNLVDELARWKAQLQLNNGFFYNLPAAPAVWYKNA